MSSVDLRCHVSAKPRVEIDKSLVLGIKQRSFVGISSRERMVIFKPVFFEQLFCIILLEETATKLSSN